MEYLLLLLPAAVLAYFISRGARKVEPQAAETFPEHWKQLLEQNVTFYQSLDEEGRAHFRQRMLDFLSHCRIVGVKTRVEDLDRVLVAAGAIIPVFAFPNWRYPNIKEVLLYPQRFGMDLAIEGPHRNTLGVVGTGRLENVMILSQPDLRHGFENPEDKRNVAIHEFVHLVDKADGQIDGTPHALLESHELQPWLELIRSKTMEIAAGRTNIDDYAASGQEEFLTVVSEYFFERPQMLEKKHPEVYKALQQIYEQKPAYRELFKPKGTVGRNASCPCGSGKKYKRCCLMRA